jgi:nitronate monooxygenase
MSDESVLIGELPRGELLALLDTLLEAERAGAKVLAAFLDDYEAESDAWRALRQVQRDEAQNCAILMGLIRGLGARPSDATGDFVGKALAVEGKSARLAFLNRGQGWVARKIREALPRLAAGPVRDALQAMHDSHLANIALCDAIIAEPR